MVMAASTLHPPEDLFHNLQDVRVADLTPDDPSLARCYLRALVVLVWPYSNSSKKLSLLLAEPNVYLRKSKGQVKVNFYNTCAEEVAKLQCGIGDIVRLALDGSSFSRTGDYTLTPGKKVEWDIELKKSVCIDARRNNVHLGSVFHQAPQSNGHDANYDIPLKSHITTPTREEFGNGLAHAIPNHSSTLSQEIPTFRSKPSIRKSINILVDLDIDADDDFSQRRGRKRTKFARHSGGWNLSTELPITDTRTEESQAGPAQESRPIDEGNNVNAVFQQDMVSNTAQDAIPPITLVHSEHSPTPDASLAALTDILEQDDAKFPAEPSVPVEQNSPLREASNPPSPQRSLVEAKLDEDDDVAILDHGLGQDPTLADLSPVPDQRRRAVASAIETTQLASPGLHAFSRDSSVGGAHLDLNGPEPIGFQQHVVSFHGQNRDDATQAIQLEVLDTSSQISREPAVAADSNERRRMDIVEHINSPERSSVIIPIEDDSSPEHDTLEMVQSSAFEASVVSPAQVMPTYETALPDTMSAVYNDSSAVEEFLRGFSPPEDQAEIGEKLVLPEANYNLSSGRTDPVFGSDDIEPRSPEADVDEFSHYLGIAAADAEDVRGGYDVTLLVHSSSPVSAQQLQLSATRSPVSEPAIVVLPHIHDQTASSDDNMPLGGSSMLTDRRFYSLHPGDTLSQSRDKEIPLRQDQHDSYGILSPSATQPTGVPALIRDDQSVHGQAMLMTPSSTQENLQPPGQIVSDGHSHIIFQPESNTPSLVTRNHIQTSVFQRTPPITPQATRLSEVHEKTTEHEDAHPRAKPPELRELVATVQADAMRVPRDRNQIAKRPESETELVPLGGLVQHDSPEDLESSDPQKEQRLDQLSSRPIPAIVSSVSTSLAYFPGLASLKDYFQQQIDLLVVATSDSSAPEKATGGPKNYFTSLHLADRSVATELRESTTAQIFRPAKKALPKARRGDILLLRNMKVQTLNGAFMVISTDSSAWVTFRKSAQSDSEELEAEINGPPVEYDTEEIEQVDELRAWWSDFGQYQFPEPIDHNQENTSAVKEMTNTRVLRSHGPSQQNSTSHLAPIDTNTYNEDAMFVKDEARDTLSPIKQRFGSRSVSVEISTSPKHHRRRSSRLSEKSMNQLRSGTRSGHHRQASQESVHELRDGTKWTD